MPFQVDYTAGAVRWWWKKHWVFMVTRHFMLATISTQMSACQRCIYDGGRLLFAGSWRKRYFLFVWDKGFTYSLLSFEVHAWTWLRSFFSMHKALEKCWWTVIVVARVQKLVSGSVIELQFIWTRIFLNVLVTHHFYRGEYFSAFNCNAFSFYPLAFNQLVSSEYSL